MQIVIAHPAVASALLAAQRPPAAAAGNPALVLDIDVEQLTGAVSLVADHLPSGTVQATVGASGGGALWVDGTAARVTDEPTLQPPGRALVIARTAGERKWRRHHRRVQRVARGTPWNLYAVTPPRRVDVTREPDNGGSSRSSKAVAQPPLEIFRPLGLLA